MLIAEHILVDNYADCGSSILMHYKHISNYVFTTVNAGKIIIIARGQNNSNLRQNTRRNAKLGYN